MGGDQTGLPDRLDMGEFSAHIGNPDGAPENAGSSGGAKSHHDLRLNQLNLYLQPRSTSLDFSGGRLFMQPALPERLRLKVFNRVRYIAEIAFNLRRFERSIQQPAGRADKWQTRSIFNVTGLFTNEKDASLAGSRPENSLGGSLPQWTAPTVLGRRLCLF
jgi:hypothetical protein